MSEAADHAVYAHLKKPGTHDAALAEVGRGRANHRLVDRVDHLHPFSVDGARARAPMPSASKAAKALGPSCTPAPISPICAACSSALTWQAFAGQRQRGGHTADAAAGDENGLTCPEFLASRRVGSGRPGLCQRTLQRRLAHRFVCRGRPRRAVPDLVGRRTGGFGFWLTCRHREFLAGSVTAQTVPHSVPRGIAPAPFDGISKRLRLHLDTKSTTRYVRHRPDAGRSSWKSDLGLPPATAM